MDMPGLRACPALTETLFNNRIGMEGIFGRGGGAATPPPARLGMPDHGPTRRPTHRAE